MQIPTFNEQLYYKLTLIGLWICGLTLPFLSFSFGATWDEKHSIEYSEQIINFFLSFGEDKSCLNTEQGINHHLIYYGNLFGLISAAIARIIPIDVFWIRHFLNGLLCFVTVLYTVKMTRLLSNERAAFIALLLIIVFPRFIGLGMNDFRDTAFAAGFIASLYYIIKVADSIPEFSVEKWIKLSMAIFFTSGIRIVGVILIGFLLIYLLWTALRLKRENTLSNNLVKKTLVYLISSLLLLYTLLVITWPFALQDIFVNPRIALFKFNTLQLITVHQLFMSELIASSDVPWNYLPVWMAITLPLISIIGLVLFVIFSYKFFSKTNELARIGLLILALLVPIFLSMKPNTNLYDGWRHYMFLIPTLMVLSALGWEFLLKIVGNKKYMHIAVTGSFFILYIMPAKSMLSYHPNQNLYFNELIGGIKGAFGKFEIEGYANPVRQGVEWLNANLSEEEIDTSLFACNNMALAFKYFGNEKISSKKIAWLRPEALFKTDWDYAVVTPRHLSGKVLKDGLWPPKENIYTIELDGVPIVSVLKRQKKFLVNAMNLLEQQKTNEGIEEMFKAVNFYDYKVEPYNMLGETFYQINRKKDAADLFKETIKIFPEYINGHFYLGLIAFEGENFIEAGKSFSNVLKFRSNNYMASIYLARSYEYQNRLRDALEIYTDLIEAEWFTGYNLAQILSNYAACEINYASKRKRDKGEAEERAEEALIRAITESQDYKIAYKQLVSLYYQQGRQKLALPYENKLKQLDK